MLLHASYKIGMPACTGHKAWARAGLEGARIVSCDRLIIDWIRILEGSGLCMPDNNCRHGQTDSSCLMRAIVQVQAKLFISNF